MERRKRRSVRKSLGELDLKAICSTASFDSVGIRKAIRTASVVSNIQFVDQLDGPSEERVLSKVIHYAKLLALLIPAPMVRGSLTLGMKWATDSESFSPFVYPAIAALLVVMALTTTVGSLEGRAAFKPQWHWLLCMIAGSLFCVAVAIQLVAVNYIPPSTVAAMRQALPLITSGMQVLVLRKWPNSLQLSQLTSLAFMLAAYSMYLSKARNGSESSQDEQSQMIGVGLAISSCLFSSLGGLVFELACNISPGTVSSRCPLFMEITILEIMGAIGFGAIAVVTDWKNISTLGLFYGCNVKVICGALLPSFCLFMYTGFVIGSIGALAFQVASVTELMFNYIVEVAFLQLSTMDLMTFALLQLIVNQVITYAIGSIYTDLYDRTEDDETDEEKRNSFASIDTVSPNAKPVGSIRNSFASSWAAKNTLNSELEVLHETDEEKRNSFALIDTVNPNAKSVGSIRNSFASSWAATNTLNSELEVLEQNQLSQTRPDLAENGICPGRSSDDSLHGNELGEKPAISKIDL